MEKPSDVLSIGSEVTAKIVDFNEADRKISLSIKALSMLSPMQPESDEDVVSVDIDAVISAQSEEEDAQ